MSLTDDFKLGKLKNGWYFCKLKNGLTHHFEFNGKDFTDLTCHIVPVAEVLAPCDYEHFVELTEKVKTLSLENERLLNLKHIDFEKVRKIVKLRELLKECKPYIKKEMETIKGAGFCNCDWAWKTSNLLTRINAAIGESEGR